MRYDGRDLIVIQPNFDLSRTPERNDQSRNMKDTLMLLIELTPSIRLDFENKINGSGGIGKTVEGRFDHLCMQISRNQMYIQLRIIIR